MKKSRILAVLAAMAMGLAVFGCKAETEYEDKVYAEAVTFTAEDAGDAGVKVAMATKTEGAAIYYTIDKSSESLKYSEPLTFSKDTEIKAFAVKEGIENSPISVVKVSIRTKTITEKVYVCAKCQKEYKTAQEAIDCCAETLDTTAPADVTDLVAAAKDSSVVLTWKDAIEEDIFGYLVSWKAESTVRALVALEKDSLIAAKGQQGCVVTGLTNGTKYTFTVKTMDTSGNKSAGVTVKATPVAVDSKEPLKIDLSVPQEKSNKSIAVTVNIATAAQIVDKVVYKKDGSEVASKLLADSSATPAKKGSTDRTWTFEITATDETANGTYTVAALDSDGRKEIAQITIDNFDFTPPAKVKGITATYSSEPKEIILNWTNPADSDFDHVEIVYTTNDGTADSAESEAISESSANKTFSGIDGTKAYYTYYIASVDKLGNTSKEVKYRVSVNKTVSNVPEGFVEIPAVSISESETWTPASNVFVRGRKLEIASFYMSDHEVTRGEYKAVMGEDPSYASAYDKDGNELTGDDNVKNNPVNNISWYDALVYCNTRSIKEGLAPCYAIDGKTNPIKWGTVPTSSDSTWNAATCNFAEDGYRLPTEAEWEWAARGGESYTYAGSNTIGDVAWYTENTNNTGTRDVKTKKANAYGLYDMSGNVWEWCWDWYGSISNETASAGPASGSRRCRRGGSWGLNTYSAQVAIRNYDNPDYCDRYYGFRLVRNAN